MASEQKRAPNSNPEQHIGKSRGGNTIKLHTVVDGLGDSVYFQLSRGNLNDNVLAIDVLSHVKLEGVNVLGDKADGTAAIREYIASRNATYTIPPKTNTIDSWDCDWWIYKERHLVECFLTD